MCEFSMIMEVNFGIFLRILSDEDLMNLCEFLDCNNPEYGDE